MLLQNRTLLILKYLWETSDEENTVSLADISEYLTESGIPSPDSRTLKKDIAQLIELGIDIVHDRRVQNQYHIATRHFDSLSIDISHISPFSCVFLDQDPHRIPESSEALRDEAVPYVG